MWIMATTLEAEIESGFMSMRDVVVFGIAGAFFLLLTIVVGVRLASNYLAKAVGLQEWDRMYGYEEYDDGSYSI